MFKLLTLALAAAFTIYGLDEMKFISADGFEIIPENGQVMEQTAPTTEATHTSFTHRIANRAQTH